MDRHRDRPGDGGGRHSRMSSRWSDGPPLGDHPPRHFSHRGGLDGFSGGRHHPYRGGGGHDYPPGGGGRSPGFRPAPGSFGGFGDEPPMPGGPRRGGDFYGRGGSPGENEGGTKFAKLFVGSVPRTATEEDIRPLFEDHGRVMEVALIKDKRTGQQQSCCFVKYASHEDAERAIRALHNQITLPGGAGPIQVRYADGERERLGAMEHKLFVGSLSKRATEKEVEEIFSPYGRVEDVYLMRDEVKQSRGCGFVKFSNREMAQAAINGLNGVFTMRGCDQPLIVRFADPKRPRPGESRGGPAFGGPGFGSRPHPPAFRSSPQLGEAVGGQIPPNAWGSVNPDSFAPSHSSPHEFNNHFHPLSAPSATKAMKPPMSPQDWSPSLPLFQNPSNSGPHMQTQSFLGPAKNLSQFQTAKDQQNSAPYLQLEHSQSPAQQLTLPIHQSAGFPSFPQALPSPQLIGVGAQLPTSQPLLHPGAATMQMPFNFQQPLPSGIDQQQLQGSIVQPLPQSVQQSAAQMLPQQAQALHSGFQSQHPISQLQQLQLIQPLNLNQQQNSQQATNTLKQQVSSTLQQISGSHAAGPAVVVASSMTSPSPSLQLSAPTSALTCSWTEHTSPEGFKYYYNSVTKESKWEKPDEFTIFEQQKLQQQQQNFAVQQLQLQSQMQVNSQLQPTHQISQLQQAPQMQLKQPAQLQQLLPSLMYQGSGAGSNQNIQDLPNPQLHGSGSAIDQARLQKGHLVSQDWMWKNKQTGP